MKKNLLTLLLVILVVMAPAVFAEETDVVEAGTAPGDAFYGMDKAMEKLSLAFTFGNEAKAKKELRMAEERLSEIKKLSTEGKVEEAKEAKEEHEKLMLKVKSRIDKIEDDDSLDQYEKELEFEAKLRDHKERAAKIEIKGELSEDAKAALEALLEALGDDVEELEIKIKTKQAETKVKVKNEHGEDDLKDIEGPHWERKADNEQVRATEEIVKAERKIALFEEKLVDFEDSDDDENETDDDVNETESDEDDDNTASGSKDKYPDMDKRNAITGQVTGNPGKEAYKDIDEDEDKTEFEDEDEYDDNIMDEYGLELPEYEEKNIESSKKYVEDAKAALDTSEEKEAAEDYKAAYAYARYAKKLAQRAMSGNYLTYTEAQKKAYENERETEDDECVVDSDCDSDEFCDSGECEDLEEDEEEIECVVDSDCDSDEFCDSGECEDLEEDEEEMDDDSDDDEHDDEEESDDDDSEINETE